MTRKEALADLIAKVGSGEIARSDLDEFIPVFGLTTDGNNALDAYRGSLDAAKALHEAVLPDGEGWEVYRTGKYPGMIPGSSPYKFAARVGYGTTYNGDSDNAARAWLLAILRALHSMEPDA